MLFHAGFSTFSGGYVGVDVFFVISGYLITSLLIGEHDQGRFSVLRFYERRARRILPALFVIMLACLPFAWLWLLPADLLSFSHSLAAVSLFSSNVLFYMETGYFAIAADLKPLLHTWSLAVEEQYYVLFPLFLMVAWRFGRRWIIAALCIGAAASLALAQWWATRHAAFTFLLLPTRGWELLLGALVAMHLTGGSRVPPQSTALPGGHWRDVAGALGIALIFVAIFRFDRATPFPSVYALAPTVGTALVIACCDSTTLVGRVLGSKPLVGIGLISYSAYLWHQPLFAFARYRATDERNPLLYLALMALALMLAYLTWRFVEQPCRDRKAVSRRTIFAVALLGSTLFVALGIAGHLGQGFASRLTPDQRRIAAFRDYDPTAALRTHRCFMDQDEPYTQFSKDCQLATGPGPTLLVWGDSYAAALSYGLRATLPNVFQYTGSGCAPLVGTEIAERSHCLAIGAFIEREVARLQPDRILLHANWRAYAREDATGAIRRTIDVIHRVSPRSAVIIVGSVPLWQPNLPVLLIRKGIGLDAAHDVPPSDFDELSRLDAQLQRVATSSGAKFVSVLDHLCAHNSCAAVIQSPNGLTLSSFDNGHLTAEGSLLVAQRLAPAL